jgi:pimeloyl-ACP methyl ester carboxylesterase
VRPRRVRARGAAALLLALLAGCTGHGTPAPRRTPAAAAPGLTGAHPCPGAAGFTCATLSVPLDHRGRQPGRLALQAAVADDADAARGVLVLLTGGPGQPGVPFVARVHDGLGPLLAGYRLVMFDQRGTGSGALRCPALQRAMGSSDLTVPPAAAVRACAAAIGPRRRFFTTADTVADLELLRAALGAGRLTLDGISYGTYVAERYALAHPDRVARLVLDSVVPHRDLDLFGLASMRAAARVLRDACREQACAGDPAADLAAVVRRRHDGPALLDTLVALSIVDPGFRGVPAALRAARQGRAGPLDQLVADVRRGQRAPAEALSQGLHASTLCADLPMPWGSAAAPRRGREAALARAAAALRPAEVWPFDRATAVGNGLVRTCLDWPPTPVAAPPAGRRLPAVPVLLLAGDRDLSTPLEWARQEAALAARGRLVVVAGAGHSVQSRAAGDAGRRAVGSFLAAA